MVVNPSFPASTLSDFIAYAKRSSNAINMGSAGTGGPNHLFAELFKALAGINMLHVPYRGAPPAIVDLIAGQIQVLWASIPAVIGYIRAGTLRALAVTTAQRSETLPDIPSIGEVLPGYDASVYFGVGAPKNTPDDIIRRLNHEINAALTDRKMKTGLEQLGGTALPRSAADYAKLISDETEKWAKVIRAANIKPE